MKKLVPWQEILFLGATFAPAFERNNVLHFVDNTSYFLYRGVDGFDIRHRRIGNNERFNCCRKPDTERNYVVTAKQTRGTSPLAY